MGHLAAAGTDTNSGRFRGMVAPYAVILTGMAFTTGSSAPPILPAAGSRHRFAPYAMILTSTALVTTATRRRPCGRPAPAPPSPDGRQMMGMAAAHSAAPVTHRVALFPTRFPTELLATGWEKAVR